MVTARPTTGSDHGGLTGLLDDDHLQYLLVDGTRAMTGNLDFGSLKGINAATPTAATDVANKAFVDTRVTTSAVEDEFTATLGQVTFVLSSAPPDLDTFTLTVNGVGYDDGVDFTVSGTTLTWLNTPFSLDVGDKLRARYIV